MKTIVSNQVKCLLCGHKPFSTSRHDTRSCECSAVTVGGGWVYLKRTGNIEEIEEMSIVVNTLLVERMIEAVDWANDTGRNSRGVVYAVFRKIRDMGYEINKK